MTSQVLNVYIYYFIFLANANCVKYKIPSNFYGSPEVFSGYSSEQQQYIDAFSLHPDHVLISGTIHEVEHGLQTSQEIGKASLKSSLYVTSCEFLEYIQCTCIYTYKFHEKYFEYFNYGSL